MGFLAIIFIIGVIIHIICSILMTFIIYYFDKIYYEEVVVPSENNPNVKVDLHKEFEPFARKDSPVNVPILFLEIISYFWIKFWSLIIITEILKFSLYFKYKKCKNPGLVSKEERVEIMKCICFWYTLYCGIAGVVENYHRIDNEKIEKIYKKYFGEDYKISYDENYSIVISNHISFIEIILAVKYFGVGFIAKKEVDKIPVVGSIGTAMKSLYVDRTNEQNRHLILEQIAKRQKDNYSEKNCCPLIIFPEGTTTSNRHIMKFKKGAFNQLLPIKPVLIKGNQNKDFHVGCGNSDVFVNYMRFLARPFTKVEYIELPIMKPTSFMYEKYSYMGNEKWEIFAEVAREIYCEVGGFEKTNMTLRDSCRYSKCLEKRKFFEPKEE